MPLVHLTTIDGERLEGDLEAAAAPEPAVGAAVVCHPHPLYGGNRQNTVVTAVADALRAAGFHTLRFDFRSAHDNGVAEQNDVIAAIDLLASQHADLPLVVCGYSFGAVVGLNADDTRIAARIAIAPPLTHMAVEPPKVPTLVLVAEHDQFCGPDDARAAIASWPDVELRVIPMADHFFAGSSQLVGTIAAEWLRDRRLT